MSNNNLIQGFQIDNQLYQYDYRTLLNIPSFSQKEEEIENNFIFPKIILNKVNHEGEAKIQISVLNPPLDIPNLGIYVFKENYYNPNNESVSIKNRHWVHPANSVWEKIGAIDPNESELNSFENKYPELLTNPNELINTGFGSGLLFVKRSRYGQNLEPITQMWGIEESINPIDANFLQTEFELPPNLTLRAKQSTITLDLLDWLMDAIKPNYFRLKIEITDNGETYQFVEPENINKKTLFNNFLNNLGGDETIDFFESSNFQDPQSWTQRDDVFLRPIQLALKDKFNLLEAEELPNNLEIIIKSKAAESQLIKKSVIYLVLIDHLNIQLMGCHNNKKRKIKNLHFKFGLVDLDSGDLLAVSPQTLVVGTKKKLSNIQINDEEPENQESQENSELLRNSLYYIIK